MIHVIVLHQDYEMILVFANVMFTFRLAVNLFTLTLGLCKNSQQNFHILDILSKRMHQLSHKTLIRFLLMISM